MISALIACFTLETCARLDDFGRHGAPLLEPYTFYRLFETDEIGLRGKARASYRQWRLNAQGYNGPELQASRIRIICLGASETFGLYEPDGLGYPRHLEAALNARAGYERYAVVNTAVPGQSLPAMARRLPETLAILGPRVAIIYPSPSLYVRPTHLRVPTSLPPPPPAGLRMPERLVELGKRSLPAPVQTRLREQAIERDPESRLGTLDRVPDSALELFRSDVRALVAALRLGGVEPVLVTHANAFTTGESPRERDLLVTWRRSFPRLEPDGFLDLERRANHAIRLIGPELDVAVVDAASAIPADPRYFADFAHFTGEGAALMGAVLADGVQPLLERRGW